jgi:hypothetical protein
MKFFFATVGIIGSGFLGYVLEPDLRFALTGQMPTTPVQPVAVVTAPNPAVATPATAPAAPGYDYSTLQPNQLPDKIVLKVQAFATAPGETDALPLPAGTKVKPTRIEGTDVHFSVLGTAQGKVAVAQTNLVEQLIANPPPAPTATPAEPTPPVVAKNEPEPTPAVEPMPEKKEEVAVQPTPEPAPTPTPTPTPATASLSAEDIVKLMQESIRSGQIKEFTFDQVIGWKAGEEEEVDGEKYQTGLAAYKAETIFGVKNIQAKAMIQGGKVIRWIWPTSGLEIQ